MTKLLIFLLWLFAPPFAHAQAEDSCSQYREVCRLKCLPKSCVEDGINCNEGRQACVKYCAQQFLDADCKSDSSSIRKPGKCKSLVSNYWPGGNQSPEKLKATCKTEWDCLNLINDLIVHCGASPVCLGSENKKVSAVEAATCAMIEAENRLKVQKAGCGGYICGTQDGFRGDKEFFLTGLISKENEAGFNKAQSDAKKYFAQVCRANLKSESDVTACLAAASVKVDCSYNINIEGDGCLYDEDAPPVGPKSKKGGGRQ